MATRNLCLCMLIWMPLFEGIVGDVAFGIAQIPGGKATVEDLKKGKYLLNMEENNHGGVIPTPLFTITGVDNTDCPNLNVEFTQGMKFKFSINESCIFYAEQTFDYESNERSYNFRISKSVNDEIDIAFSIKNIDDEPPQLGTFKCNFNEQLDYSLDDTPCNTTLHDPDGWLAQEKILIFIDTKDEDIFAIDLRKPLPNDTETDTYVFMYLLKQLNYEDTNFYQFTVQANDSGGNLSPQESAVVNVINIRSRPPKWSKITLFDQFDELTEQDYDIQALDGDTGIHADICYAKLGEDLPDNYINVSTDKTNKKGHIHVNPIDRDKDDLTLYHFNISAYVCDAPDYFTVNTVQYYIIDIDNNPPRIVENVGDDGKNTTFDDDNDHKNVTLSYLENYSRSYNFSTTITDRDTGENAQFTVSLENVEGSTVDYTQPYLIVPDNAYKTGSFIISVKNKTFLDFENDTWKKHSYYVVSNGKKDKSKTDRMLISVSLEDYNDELPIFEKESYTTEINETVANGTQILYTHATDRDAEDFELKMNIVGTYAENRLSIDKDGNIKVKVVNAFDYDVLNSVYFQVTATDKVNHVTRVPVTINILDVNNKAPVINQVDHIQIEENQQNGVVLNVTITATDVDTTANLTATINWEDSKVTKTNGAVVKTDAVIKAMQFLEIENTQTDDGLEMKLKVINNNDDNPDKPDFETFDTLYLSIVVEDRNTDPDFEQNRYTEGQIVINILDVNDNPPYFPPSNDDTRQVQEMSLKGVSVGSIKAVDVDLNSEITYHCTPEYEKFDWVDVNLTTGAITVKNDKQVDADTDKTYYFNYTCWAHDGVFFSKPLDISIYVIDTNNEVPVIDFPNEVHVKEKSLIDTVIKKIVTSDLDRDEPFRTVNCNFASDTDPDCQIEFYIDTNVLKVKRNKTLDRDKGRKTYPCLFECLDNPLNVRSQGQNKANKSFTIILDDINDHAPVLMTKDLQCSENLNKDGEVGEGIIGEDIDDGDNAKIDFSVLSIVDKETKNDIQESFNISKIDSDYVLNDTLKKVHLIAFEDLKGKYGTYEVTLHMHDEGDPMQTTDPDPTLTLTIEKWNYQTPSIIFPENDQTYIVLSDQQPGQPLALFNNTGTSNTLPDFSATDGETKDCSKWDVKFSYTQTNYEDDKIFVIDHIQPCVSQLQVSKHFNSDLVRSKKYKLTITASVKDGAEQEGEAGYSTSANISIVFLNNDAQPIFQNSDWSVSFVEFNTTQPAKPLEEQAEYENTKGGLPIYYHFYSENQTLSKYFEVDETSGDLSVIGNLTYDYDQDISFHIVASNDSQVRMLDPRSSLNVTVNFLPRNRRAPQWKSTKFFGAVMPTFVTGNLIVTAQAHDDDYIDQQRGLTCSISSEINRIGEGLDKIIGEPFYLSTENDAAKIFLDFTVQTTMTGRFEFKIKVEDNRDDYGNGPFESEADTTIFIITKDNTVDFQFYNDIEDVQDRETPMLKIISDIVGYDAYRQNIDTVTNSGLVRTRARLYFIDSKSSRRLQRTKSPADSGFELVNSETILNIVTNVNTFQNLASTLRSEQKLNLDSFETNSKSGNSEAALRAWLIGVSVVLGILVLLLLITLILKTRQLSNRIKKLTTPQFGSQESGLNRMGINAPTTNKHAIEGTNPVYNNNEIKKPKNMNDFDTHSIRSGDSDLVGIENNPEFDYNFNTNEDKTTYL
ncbi:cadherin-23 [Diabrotica virgifera virgifera]|uniref:Cadherin-23-like n=1 Tax=Diabrotica virgifera virgifera TaxID=50390 RepID=A0A6P7F4Z6_DIAVI|nr:cadherin-23 [Diabrotica virgifera virgifera]XP_050506902.1 cadherin-23 [Diabrotica virgifera virgifera]KAI2473957.1 hypothetical protein C4B38_000055 [Diabrotica virgifera virgifera]